MKCPKCGGSRSAPELVFYRTGQCGAGSVEGYSARCADSFHSNQDSINTRNSDVLRSFVTYCIDHPNERFWQALRNWSGYQFIFGQDFRHASDTFEDSQHGLIDTFNIEGKRHDRKES